jgi:internalin A
MPGLIFASEYTKIWVVVNPTAENASLSVTNSSNQNLICKYTLHIELKNSVGATSFIWPKSESTHLLSGRRLILTIDLKNDINDIRKASGDNSYVPFQAISDQTTEICEPIENIIDGSEGGSSQSDPTQSPVNNSLEKINSEYNRTINEIIKSLHVHSWYEAYQKLQTLEFLDLSEKNLSNLEPLRGLTHLNQLDLSRNHIKNIEPLSGLTGLMKLNLFENDISNLEPLRGLTQLVQLDLFKNKISNLEPLRSLYHLKTLDLSNNSISNVEPLSGLTQLTELDLYHNQIRDVEYLQGLTQLVRLDLEQNPLVKNILE